MALTGELTHPRVDLVRSASASVDGGADVDAQVACTMNATGALLAQHSCAVDNDYEADGGLRRTIIAGVARDAGPRGPVTQVMFHVFEAPTIGRLREGTFIARARTESATATWEATAGSRGSIGTLTVTLSSTGRRKVGKTTTYDLHGRIEAQLLPTVEGTATGAIDLLVDF